MLYALAQSQSMGKLLYAFKNVRNMDKFLEENASAPDGNPPILTRQTMAYAISLSISCICLHANEDILKGRASAAYERAMTDFESMSDATWHSLLLDVLVRYGTHLTNPEGPAPSAPMLTKHQILQSDNARKEARAASAAAASAASAASDSLPSARVEAVASDSLPSARVEVGEGKSSARAAFSAEG